MSGHWSDWIDGSVVSITVEPTTSADEVGVGIFAQYTDPSDFPGGVFFPFPADPIGTLQAWLAAMAAHPAVQPTPTYLPDDGSVWAFQVTSGLSGEFGSAVNWDRSFGSFNGGVPSSQRWGIGASWSQAVATYHANPGAHGQIPDLVAYAAVHGLTYGTDIGVPNPDTGELYQTDGTPRVSGWEDWTATIRVHANAKEHYEILPPTDPALAYSAGYTTETNPYGAVHFRVGAGGPIHYVGTTLLTYHPPMSDLNINEYTDETIVIPLSAAGAVDDLVLLASPDLIDRTDVQLPGPQASIYTDSNGAEYYSDENEAQSVFSVFGLSRPAFEHPLPVAHVQSPRWRYWIPDLPTPSPYWIPGVDPATVPLRAGDNSNRVDFW